MLISCTVIVQIRPAPRSGGNAAHLRKHQPIEPMFVYDGTKDLVVFSCARANHAAPAAS
jgi:hypothetical protein